MGEAVRDLNIKINDNLTPRDRNRMPQNPDAKITGNLKRATQNEQVSKYKWKIGVLRWWKWSPEEYGTYLEFGTRYMQPRSFLRLWLTKYKPEFMQEVVRIANKLLK